MSRQQIRAAHLASLLGSSSKLDDDLVSPSSTATQQLRLQAPTTSILGNSLTLQELKQTLMQLRRIQQVPLAHSFAKGFRVLGVLG